VLANILGLLFYHYRKFLHFKVFPLFSRCDYKLVWLIKEKLLDSHLGSDYDPEFADGLNLERIAEDYTNDGKFKEVFGEIKKSAKTSVMMEIKKKIEKLEASDLVEIQSKSKEGRHIKWIKFNLNWNAFPIFYSIGVFATFLIFHAAQVIVKITINSIV
jgi:hypothetical protein